MEWGPPSTMEARNFDGLSCSLGVHEQSCATRDSSGPTLSHDRSPQNGELVVVVEWEDGRVQYILSPRCAD